MFAPSRIALVSLLAVVVVESVGAHQAAAAPKAPAAKKAEPAKTADTVDISTYRDKLEVFSDDDGVLYVLRNDTLRTRILFVGDGKNFYQQTLIGGGSDGSTGNWSISIKSPRASGKHREFAILQEREKHIYLDCGDAIEGDARPPELRRLPAEAAAKVVDAGTFHPVFWTRRSYQLARDDAGTYYYVDKLADSEEGYRVFVGKRGAMKEQPMKSVATDSAGDVFSTRRGELRFVLDSAAKPLWIQGRKRVELKSLPVEDNLYLIYRGLGIYGFLGMVCEDR